MRQCPDHQTKGYKDVMLIAGGLNTDRRGQVWRHKQEMQVV